MENCKFPLTGWPGRTNSHSLCGGGFFVTPRSRLKPKKIEETKMLFQNPDNLILKNLLGHNSPLKFDIEGCEVLEPTRILKGKSAQNYSNSGVIFSKRSSNCYKL